jgi:hypothetical protein
MKAQERIDRSSRKRSSSARSEKVERFGEKKKKMERYCSTGQSSQRAGAPTEEEEIHPRSKTRSRGRVLLHNFFNLGTEWRWVVKVTPRPLYPRGLDKRVIFRMNMKYVEQWYVH